MQDLGHDMWLQDLTLIPFAMTLSPRVRDVTVFHKFCDKTDRGLPKNLTFISLRALN